MYTRSDIKDIYPLSPMQEGMLLHSMLSDSSKAYFEQMTLDIEGYIDLDIYEESFNRILKRYDILRTVFMYEKVKSPVQVVLKERKAKIYYEDISSADIDKKLYVEQFKEADKERGFDLTKDMLIRIAILKIGQSSYKVIWSFHHILMDGWCLGIIMGDFAKTYYSLKTNTPVNLPPTYPYSNFIKWIYGQNKEKVYGYWNKYLEGYEEQAVIPFGRSSEGSEYEQEDVFVNLSEELTEAVNYLAKKQQLTANTIFQAVWGIILQRYNNKNDVVFGAVVSGRPTEVTGIESMLGLFINTIPVRIKADRSGTFRELISSIHDASKERQSYEFAPLAEIQANTELKQGLIDHIMVFENYPIEDEVSSKDNGELLGFSIKGIEVFEQTNYDFNITVLPRKEYVIQLSYNKAKYDSELIANIGRHFINVLTQATQNPDIRYEDIELADAYEKSIITKQFNNTFSHYPEHKVLQELFEEQAEKMPDEIAVSDSIRQLTYRQLNEKANQLARTLRNKGVEADSIVALLTERTIEMVIGIWGILKAGGAYLPIDPEYPMDRIEYMLKDSGAKLVLHQGSDESWKSAVSQTVDIINLEDSEAYNEEAFNLDAVNSPNSLAYIIYTSGSTGNPKGVMVEHRNVVNLCSWLGRTYNYKEIKNVIQMTNITFDVSVEEIIGTLVNGSTICLARKEEVLNSHSFIEFIKANKINMAQFVPITLEQLLPEDKKIETLKVIICGGDRLGRSLRERILNIGYNLYNNYGPTEITVDAIYTKCEHHKDVIGKPVSNTKTYIVDKYNRLCPVGVPGELCISGHGVARGYLNREELTREKFADNPFEGNLQGYEKMYRTGDLARWLPDGNIEFIGRIDQQVKIRGFRIELGEIENKLSEHEAIREAVVTAKQENDGSKYLCAYLVADKDKNQGRGLTVAELREHLGKTLPDYMVPSYFIQLEQMPLTASGKIDRKKLPDPDGSMAVGVEYEAPQNEAEERLIEIWKEVLGIETIGVNDNFFMLGGDSIKAIQVCSRLQKYKMKLEVRQLLQNPVIKAASRYILFNSANAEQGIITGEIQLTPIQGWFFEQGFTNMQHWNQAVMLFSEKGFNEKALRTAFDKLVEQHDILRAVFEIEEGRINQKIKGLEGQLYELRKIDLSSEEGYEEIIRQEADKIQAGISLSKGPIVKLGLFHTAKGDHLLIVIHHLVIDGVSWRILFEDLAAAYNNAESGKRISLQEKTDSFKKWSEELAKYSNSTKHLRELEYWMQIEEAKILPLPKDNATASAKVRDSEIIAMELSKEETSKLLKKANLAYSTEINDILLTSLGISVKEWTGSERVLVSLESHGRSLMLEGMNITRTVGWFTSEYPVILDMSVTDDLSHTIIKTKEDLRKIPNNGIGYGIFRYLTLPINKKELQFRQKAELSFNYLGQFDKEINTELFQMSKISAGSSVSLESERTHSIEVNGVILDNKLQMSLSYNKHEYTKQTMENLLNNYKDNLINIIQHCVDKNSRELTPSDLTGRKIEIDELDRIKNLMGELGISQSQVEDIYPLSPMQEGMLFHAMLESESNVYFEQTTLYVEGQLDIRIFEDSFNNVIGKYGVLRTIFAYEGLKRPYQIVLKDIRSNIEYIDITQLEQDKKLQYVEEYKAKDRGRGFALFAEIPIRAAIIRLEESKYAIIWSSHHIIMDGWCLSLIMRDFFKGYQLRREGKSADLGRAENYGEYIAWLEEQSKDEAVDYWSRYLEGYKEKARVPATKQIKSKGDYENKIKSTVLEHELTNNLISLSKAWGVTLNAVMQAFWGFLLQNYNNTKDVVFGAVVSGRPAEIKGIEEMVGLFINTIPVRFISDGADTMEQAVKALHAQALEARKYEYVSLAEIQTLTILKQDLLDNIMAFENYPVEEQIENSARINNTGFEAKSIDAFTQTNYNFNLTILPGETITIAIGYNGSAYEDNQIEAILSHFRQVVNAVTSNKDIRLEEIQIITEKEKQQLLYDFNNTSVDYPKDRTIQQVFEEQAERTPDNIALIFEDKQLTYRELNTRANQLARTLRSKGVLPDSLVAVITERSIEMIVGILAVLKSGAAYLPVDTDYPQDRIQYVLKDSGADIILVNNSAEALRLDLKDNITIINLDEESSYASEMSNLDIINNSNSLAYVIYTSGSTGKPKGAMLEHHSVLNLVYCQRNRFNIDESDRILQFSSICFDASVEQIFTCLLSGAALVLVSKDVLLDYSKFEEYLIKQEVTHLNAVPAFLSGIKWQDSYKIRRVISGGDVCPVKLIEEWYKHCDFYNVYGPTEAAVTSTSILADNETDLHVIGKPIANTRIYILSPSCKLQPIGIAGELCISGEGLARGYLNREELTKERFVDNPFEKGSIMYRTGDLARWLPNGNVEFLGRIDNQVKIRGFRIELNEIEAKLLEYSLISDAAVEAITDSSNNKFLCAFIAAKDIKEQKNLVAELRRHLSQSLPEYMIPAQFVKLDKLPLTPSGKVDRRLLSDSSKYPELNGNIITASAYEAPRNPIEERLADIWKDILKLDRVGISDSFFELGGHSLKAASMIARLRKDLNVEVPLKQVFSTSTIKGIADYITGLDKNIYEEIPAAEQSDIYPEGYFEVSSAQKRLYALQQFDLQSIAYNMPAALLIEGELDIQRLNDALLSLIERHDSLRTSFEILKGDIIQKINKEVEFKINEYEAPMEELDTIIRSFVKAFDLSKAPLVRAGLIKLLPKQQHCSEDMENPKILPKQHYSRAVQNVNVLPNNQHLLIVEMHHIISDGVSAEIIVREFIALYNQEQLPALRIQYKDYSVWHNKLMKSELMKQQREYWLKAFEGELPVLALHTDYQRPSIQSFKGDRVSFSLDTESANKLRILGRETGATLYMLLLAAFNVMLYKYTGQEDIIIGSPIAGRPHGDLENIVGMFVNTLPMRNYPNANISFREFISEVKATALKAYENQSYQFDELVDKLNIRRDMSRNPLFDVVLVMQNIEQAEFKLNGLNIKGYQSKDNISKFDITLEAAEAGETIELCMEYCTRLFKRETIERMAEHLKNIVKEMTADIDKRLSEIDMLSKEEKHKLLYEFNETAADYPKHKTIHQLFEEQVQKTPDNIAVVYEAEASNSASNSISLTYRELNAKANQLARLLRAEGVKADTIVAMAAEKSAEMIIGILGILKAGGAYLPIDPEYPTDRIEYTIEDSGAGILLTSGSAIKELSTAFGEKMSTAFGEKMSTAFSQKLSAAYGDKLKVIDLEAESSYQGEADNLEIINKAEDMAYVIYTSGTTGKPKGAIIEHRNVVRLMFNDKMQFDFKETDVWTMFHSYCFDFSVWEMYGALLYGGKLIVIPKTTARDVWEYLRVLREHKVTILNQTPSAFYRLIEEEQKSSERQLETRYVIFGGEALKPIMLKEYKERYPATKLINMYGITETTVHVTYKEIGKEEIEGNISNIGKPIPTLTAYIMDKEMKLMPIGAAGELCVGGEGLGRGYLNRDELTGERFVTNPYKPEERLYKSGDLARLLPNGEMEYLGRIDHQVKIRGFRIELGEIETVLKNHSEVKSVVVLPYNMKGTDDKKLVAYVVPKNKDMLTDGVLRSFMRERLPDYMIPAVFIMLEAIPITSNGKVDRRALPVPEIERTNDEKNYIPPSTDKERILSEIWAEVLGLDRVGINESFFDLGGDSIYSIKAAALAKEKGLNCSVQQIFLHQTIGELAKHIDMTELQADNEKADAAKDKPKAFELLSGEDTAKLFGLKKKEWK